MFSIKNDVVTLSVEQIGAQITSFRRNDLDYEYMWNGDEKYWAGKNPILFPIVGSTYDKLIHIDGKEYTMGNHGVLRKASFEWISNTDDEIVMSFKANEETLKEYPYQFVINVSYKLVNNKVLITYTICNNDDKEMPFGFGLHPAFNCPLDKTKKFEDYYLEFSGNETLKTMLGSFQLNNERIIKNSYELYDAEKTILFEYPKSSYVRLTDGKHGVQVDLVGYKYIAFWTKDNAPFLCIEPWHTHGDFEKCECDFKDRPDTMKISPKSSYTTAYSIAIF